MKTITKLLTGIAIMIITGFTFLSCDNPADGNGGQSGNVGESGNIGAISAGVYGIRFQRMYGNVYQVIWGRETTGGAVVIPATHNGLPVFSIGASAFSRNQLTSVTIPDICTFTQNT